VFEGDPLCDICRKHYACDEIEWGKLPPRLARILGGNPDEDEQKEGELVCSGCLGLLIEQVGFFSDVTTIKNLKVVECGTCQGKGKTVIDMVLTISGRGKGNQHSKIKSNCRACRGTGERLAKKSALERLAEAAE